MIQLQNVTKEYGRKKAVDNVSFEVKKGEIIGFLGLNGAGKTTTMRLILGYIQPTSGEVSVTGKHPLRDRIQILQKIGYLPENNPLYTEMKVNEYLRYVAEIKTGSKNHQASIQAIVNKLNLTDVEFKKIEELSRGYKQRVGLAAALIGDPEILILDEPTSGLDPIEQDNIKDLIRTIAQKKLVIFSTHMLSEAEDVANRLIIIHQGKIVYDGEKPQGKQSVEKLFKQLVNHQKRDNE